MQRDCGVTWRCRAIILTIRVWPVWVLAESRAQRMLRNGRVAQPFLPFLSLTTKQGWVVKSAPAETPHPNLRSGRDWHSITCSCYHRRDLFLQVLEETRKKYQFVVAGYVVMPEHFHLLIGESKIKNPTIVMQVLKQRVARKCRARKREAKRQLTLISNELPRAFWQAWTWSRVETVRRS